MTGPSTDYQADFLQSQIIYAEHLPRLDKSAILIYDKALLQHKFFSTWIKKFPYAYAVSGGEKLKDIQFIAQHLEKILRLTKGEITRQSLLVSIGGGSVGDFAGFVASILKRGMRLVHIPSTWLAAIDSAHGGKTALNVLGFKNQVGSFYPAEKIYLVKELLFSQPFEQSYSALGELIKAAWIEGGKFWLSLSQEMEINSQVLWNYLPLAIATKYKIILRDPYETKGVRYLLNLGHTYGHVMESHLKLPHGIAVGVGLQLALELSYKNNFISKKDYLKLVQAPIMKNILYYRAVKKLPQTVLKAGLTQDKKRSIKNSVNFVFIKKAGQVFVRSMEINQLVSEYSQIYARK